MGHRATVDDVQVGLVQGRRDPVPVRHQPASESLHLGLIQLAAEVAQKDPHRAGILVEGRHRAGGAAPAAGVAIAGRRI